MWVASLSLAAFLTLYWALRGAPPGQAVADQEDDEAPAAAYRDRVIAAVVVGLLLVGAGAYVALSGNLAWSIPLFACGFAIVLRLIVVNQRYRHASPALQRTIGFSNAALNASLLAGVLIVLNVVTFRYGGQPLDFTRERAFSLSSLTRNQLASLKRQVTLTMLYGEGPRAVPLAERVRQLLELYKAAQPEKVEIQSLDPFRNPERFEELAKRAPDVAVIQGGGVLIEYGEGESASRVVVRNNDLFELPAQGGREGSAVRFETEFRGEDAITSALIGLREEKKPKIVFTVGHGESSINEVDPRKSGLGVWKSRLTSDGSEVLEINLIKDEIPADASAMVVAAPKSPFKSDEIAKLKTYSEKGGPLLFLFGGQLKTGLEDFLKSFNLEFGNGAMFDRRLSLRGRPDIVVVPIEDKLKHPVVNSLASRAAFFLSASPIRILGEGALKGSPVNPRYTVATLLRTSRDSWAESDLTDPRVEFNQGKDEAGPQVVGVAVTDRPEPGKNDEPIPKLVLLSSNTFGDNLMLNWEPTNANLLMNALSWLRGRPDLQGIAPKTHVSMTLAADPLLQSRLVMVPTVMGALLIIGFGISTYWLRRE
ncbi:GldG family protein [Singulisphaera sp. PoT]|uniref:GldG family protein n=1 Tax=Singulisphaera sp. PoT TaxID=3411797 RepID=UPI003BF544B0